MINRILRREEVESVTGMSRSTIYLWMKEGKFPKAVKLGTRCVGWKQSEIEEWCEARERFS